MRILFRASDGCDWFIMIWWDFTWTWRGWLGSQLGGTEQLEQRRWMVPPRKSTAINQTIRLRIKIKTKIMKLRLTNSRGHPRLSRCCRWWRLPNSGLGWCRCRWSEWWPSGLGTLRTQLVGVPKSVHKHFGLVHING